MRAFRVAPQQTTFARGGESPKQVPDGPVTEVREIAVWSWRFSYDQSGRTGRGRKLSPGVSLLLRPQCTADAVVFCSIG